MSRDFPRPGRQATGLALVITGVLACAATLVAPKTGAAGCPGTNPEIIQWLDRMSRSSHQADYHGVVTLERGGEMQVMQLSHRVGAGSTSEYLTQLTGQSARIERSEHPLDCVHPGHQLLRMSEELQSGRCGVAENYRFALDEGEQIAGRQAVRIRVDPRDLYRYGYDLELDRDTGLLLKARIVGRGGKTLERFQFARLTFRDVQPTGGEAEIVHQAAHPHPGDGPVEGLPSRDWAVTWLPGGFMPTDAPAGGSSRRSYTDGLAVFSVFLEQLGTAIRPGEGVVRKGGTTSYTRGMQLGGSPILVTVIGEVPVNTARMVADSVGWTR